MMWMLNVSRSVTGNLVKLIFERSSCACAGCPLTGNTMWFGDDNGKAL